MLAGLIAAGAFSSVQLLLIFLDSHLDFYTSRVSIRVETALLTCVFKSSLNTNALPAPEVSIKLPGLRCTQPLPGRERSGLPEGAAERMNSGSRPGRKGAIFNIVFVDIPSTAQMVLAMLDLFILPFRVAISVILLVLQVCLVAGAQRAAQMHSIVFLPRRLLHCLVEYTRRLCIVCRWGRLVSPARSPWWWLS